MTIKKLKNLADKNEVRVDDHQGHSMSPPHYYLLQEAFSYYFKTFITKNASYEFYVSATSTDKRKALTILEHQFLDIENTVFCLVAFQRFFELFIKDFLRQTHAHLIHEVDKVAYDKANRKAPQKTHQIIQEIRSKKFLAKKDDRKRYLTIPFSEAIKRFYALLTYSKLQIFQSDFYVLKFLQIVKPFAFIHHNEIKATFEFINWYRNRILHSGNRLPRMRFLDFIIIHRVIPLTNQIIQSDSRVPQEWKFFTETDSGFKILEEMKGIRFDLRNSKSIIKINETFTSLLYLGHLKELGRAALNMNHNMKSNRATHEYNYHDSKGRGKRFAEIEHKEFPNTTKIMKCSCCSVESLVRYTYEFNSSQRKETVQEAKCYTCDYHLRSNVLDLHYFNNKFEKIFDY